MTDAYKGCTLSQAVNPLEMSQPDTKPESDNVRVAIRCRPLSDKEKETSCQMAVNINRLRGEVIIGHQRGRGSSNVAEKTFTFDLVFDMDAAQTEVYNETARPIVESVLEGYNGTVIDYTQAYLQMVL